MRSAKEIKHLREIGVGRVLGKSLEAYPIEEIIRDARLGLLTGLPNIGEAKAKNITELLDEAGFIFHESRRSAAMRKLLRNLQLLPDIRRPEVYEAQKEFSERHLLDFEEVIDSLGEQPAAVLRACYGLEGGAALSFRGCGLKLNMSHETARTTYYRALAQLCLPEKLSRLAGIVNAALDTP